jgi:hypothetical protein
VLINHRKCLVSSDKWSIQEASNHRKGLNAQKEGSCFRTSQMSNFAAMMRSSNRRKRASWELMFVRGFQPKAPKLLRVIHCKNHFQICASGDSQIRLHGASLLSHWQIHSPFSTGYPLILKLKVSLRSPRIAGDSYQHAIFSTNRDFQILVPRFEQTGIVAPNSTSISRRVKRIGLSGKPVSLSLSKFHKFICPERFKFRLSLSDCHLTVGRYFSTFISL